MTFPRRPHRPKPPGGGYLPSASFDDDTKPVAPKPKRVGWNGGRELPPVPFLMSPDQEVGAEIAIRATKNIVGTAADATKAAVRGVLGNDELGDNPEGVPAPLVPQDAFGHPTGSPDPRKNKKSAPSGADHENVAGSSGPARSARPH